MAAAERTRVALYARRVGASLERVWENVLDWEHLPWLHAGSFRSIELHEAGAWGWRARVGVEPRGDEVALELRVEREAGRYVTRTVAGRGAGSEIWTSLRPDGPDATVVTVAFEIADVPPDRAQRVGLSYVRLYARLWDEDEAMMRRRTCELARLSEPALARVRVSLGTLAELRPRLPLPVVFGGRRFRVVEDQGELLAHATVCPHRLGPLEESAVQGGRVRCPWHGYSFDLRSGRCPEDPRLALRQAPRVEVDPNGRVFLVPAFSSPS
ncbi:MAG: Rieske 2Fe-2S domain-containing protein [Myxococcota bacterium]